MVVIPDMPASRYHPGHETLAGSRNRVDDNARKMHFALVIHPCKVKRATRMMHSCLWLCVLCLLCSIPLIPFFRCPLVSSFSISASFACSFSFRVSRHPAVSVFQLS